MWNVGRLTSDVLMISAAWMLGSLRNAGGSAGLAYDSCIAVRLSGPSCGGPKGVQSMLAVRIEEVLDMIWVYMTLSSPDLGRVSAANQPKIDCYRLEQRLEWLQFVVRLKGSST